MSEFDEIYRRRRPALTRAEARLRSLLEAVVSRIEDRKLVRAEFDDVRSKSLSELESKARKFGWSAEDAFVRCSDLVGGRVVCNNVEDVYRFEELLKARLQADSGRIEREDYIYNPNRHGYRALHLNFRLNVSRTSDPELIPCEVQIRSRLQDAWAELSHDDIYKQKDLPLDLLDRVKDLSDLLAQADSTASSIRARVQRMTLPVARPSVGRNPADTMTHTFKDVLGSAPARNGITKASDSYGELRIVPLNVEDHPVDRGSAGVAADRRKSRTSKQPSRGPLTNWNIYLAKRTPAKWLGTVEAEDVDAAIQKAAKEFNVRDPRRLIAVQQQ
jgi:ppGpp synthetase/RelA/SpoT-type nucleotidyltranferase